MTTNGPIDNKREVWTSLDTLAAQAAACFPLSAAQCADLRGELQARLSKIITAEEAALAEILR